MLDRVAELVSRRAGFAEHFFSMVHTWSECVDARAPRIVCRDLDSLNFTLDVLATLGTMDQQLRFEAVGSLQALLIAAILEMQPSTRGLVSGRFSRGPKRVRVEEVGILIDQKAGSRIPEGRDFHRLLAITACILLDSNYPHTLPAN